MNFSSNIFAYSDLTALKAHLCRRIDVIGNYPEPEPLTMARALANQQGIAPESILVTSGATEAIYLIAQAMRGAGYTHCWVRQPTFIEYADACRVAGLVPTVYPSADTVSWLCNPNNPTGEILSGELPCEGIVVVDQSYEDYTASRLMSPAEAVAHGNVFQLHSLTKTYAIPGLRIGYVVAAPQLINLLRSYVRPWSVNAMAVEAGLWLLSHGTKSVTHLEAYLAETARLRQMLCALPGISVLPTETNFMLAHIESHTASQLKDYLARQRHILIRDASNFTGLTPHHFRVATQLPAENDALVAAISDYLNSHTS